MAALPCEDVSDEEGAHVHGFGIEIPAGFVQAITHGQDTRRAVAQDRYNSTMRWLDSLDVEGLLALRWILATDEEEAYGNTKYFDGMCFQLLRAKGVDPNTGEDPAVKLLEREALRPSPKKD